MAAFATSYIKTEATQETRNADAASMTGTNFSSWFNNGAGTLYAEAAPIALSQTTDKVIAAICLSGSASNTIEIYKVAAAGTGAYYVAANSSMSGSANVSNTFSAAGAFGKLAFAYSFNDLQLYTNAGSTTPDTNAILPQVNLFGIGSRSLSGSVVWCGTIKKIAYYPQRLTNANLQALTA